MYSVELKDGRLHYYQTREEALDVYERCNGTSVAYRSHDLFPQITVFIDRPNVDIRNVRKEEDIVNKTSFAMRKAITKYDTNNTKQIKMKLNTNTDSDILKKLESVENVQGYLKELIRKDITKNSRS